MTRRAMILAAGRGERMRPLTDTVPKPLLVAGGRTLIEHTIARLAAAGFHDLVINHAWCGEQIVRHLGDGAGHGVRITYSPEPEGALEAAGGIAAALPHLGDAPFVVVNGDIWCDFPLDRLRCPLEGQAHLVLVDNPPHHPEGDFHLDRQAVHSRGVPALTFSGIGLYHPSLFSDLAPGRHALAPLLRAAMDAGRVSGEHHRGQWLDIGTPERLHALDAALRE